MNYGLWVQTEAALHTLALIRANKHSRIRMHRITEYDTNRQTALLKSRGLKSPKICNRRSSFRLSCIIFSSQLSLFSRANPFDNEINCFQQMLTALINSQSREEGNDWTATANPFSASNPCSLLPAPCWWAHIYLNVLGSGVSCVFALCEFNWVLNGT